MLLLNHRLNRVVFAIAFVVSIMISSTVVPAAQRIGIVYSQVTANQFYDPFAYTQLFMAMQHQAMMAGIPYDLLSEDDLTNANKIANYNALVIPAMQNVTTAKLTAIETTLDQAIANGLGLIVAGELLAYSETGVALPGNAYARMNRWLGLSYSNSMSNVTMSVNAQDINHPVMRLYTANETILNYNPIWINSYQPIPGQTANVLATLQVNGQTYNGVMALQTPTSRHVHFASNQVMGDSNLVWPALHWVIYGNQTPVGLKLGRQPNLFISRNDMDSSMFASELVLTEIPLYGLLQTWKQNYNFVGSYYLNIGNNPSANEFTNWNISAPLYQDYIALGNEIGTGSWTHPDQTGLLNATQLEFEFNQSRITLSNEIGTPVIGAAIPGNPEPLSVDQQLAQYFEYISGRASVKGSGYPGAFGRMQPGSNIIYFSLNMSPDFTLVEFLGNTPAQTQSIWANEYNNLLRHASQPIIHWLWHDYGPTISSNPGPYNVPMYTDTIAMAYNNGSEFVTLADLQQRIRTFETADLTVTGTNPVMATVTANAVGMFSLMLQSDQVINRVTDWYAYDADQVFLAQNGGQFEIHLSTTQADITHITALPMRAQLITTTGNGTALSFSFVGEGTVSVQLNTNLAADLAVQGNTDFTQQGNQLKLKFANAGTHTVNLSLASNTNIAPLAFDQSMSTDQNKPVNLTLTANDSNNDPLNYTVLLTPNNGQLSGTAPNLTYTPNAGYIGNDSFTFKVDDNVLDSNTATVSLTITPFVGPISNPVTNLTIDGNLTDWNGLISLGPDPDDVTGTNNQLDWLEAWLAHDNNNIYLAFRNDGPINLSWGHGIYFDTDMNPATGLSYSGFYPIGIDYMIEGNGLYQYTGTGSDWSWQFIATLTPAINGNQAEFSFARALIGNPTQLRLFFIGENMATGGDARDYYPDDVINGLGITRFFEYLIAAQ